MSGPTVRLACLPAPVVALLRAVHDALDVPLPGLTDADERAHAVLLHQRAREAWIVLGYVLDDGHEVGPSAESLRAWTARNPVEYTPWDGGGVA
ncbi:hypothetical protein QNN03_30470 [Streptomyces sp. GXMU-J15]|uniref:DUF4253 domain-containing protein n=1 Tax=Streptomyces fuscus TaxID=3048495 RepID=A0ABT7J7C8_9ACTN|nr:hypothetical protein [Streptomyces fuscus]MDL2080778.1 hypothetical protein [Streptomyces fuscus]